MNQGMVLATFTPRIPLSILSRKILKTVIKTKIFYMKKLSLFLVLFSTLTSVLMTDCKKDPVPPTVTTTAVSDITTNSARAGGEITDDGGAGVLDRGVAYSQSPEPTIENDYVSGGDGSGSFTVELGGLAEATMYYVRAYATNGAGTSYGNQETFSTAEITLATVSTKAVSEISYTTAVSGGEISGNGGSEVTEKGVVWGTSENPTIENNKTSDGTGNEGFTSNLTGLNEGTIYYVRAYATNVKGTAYGNQETFTTTAVILPTVETKAVTEISTATAVSGGTVTNDGGSAITAKGICWNTSENPTIENSHTTDGTGPETFNSNLTGLLPGTTYYVRAYSTNVKGTAYGNQVSFTTSAGLPSVTTKPVTEITLTTATSGGDIVSNGGSTITAKGICWSTSENPTVENSNTNNGTGTEGFNSNLTGLTDGTTYYVRAYATNSVGTAYGNQVSFTTASPSLPAVSTKPVTQLQPFSARSGGEISSNGGAPVTAKGIVWGKTENPTISDSHTSDGTGDEGFDSDMTPLEHSTTYYVRAYATNRIGTAYGNQLTFTTPMASSPVLTTANVTSLTPTSAISGGDISSNGGAPVTQRGVVWNTAPNPTIANNRTTNGTGSGVFASNITGLTNGTVYYVRAYATNSQGTGYGNEIMIVTPVTDIDGNIYKTVKIGNQVWMAENLKTTRYRNNTAIPLVTDTAAWKATDTLQTAAYSWYNNNPANKDLYGGLYNWFAVNTGNLCPTGWHVATEAEYQTLELTVGVPADSVNTWGFRGNGTGTHLKSTTGWTGGNGDNTSGFTAVPAGYRAWANGSFRGVGIIIYFWTATDDAINHKPEQAWYRRLDATDHRIYKATTHKGGGKSIRCLKNM